MVKTSDNFALNMMNLCEMTVLSEFMHETVVYIIIFEWLWIALHEK